MTFRRNRAVFYFGLAFALMSAPGHLVAAGSFTGFRPPIAVPIGGAGPRSVALGDVNGGGTLDIVTANAFSNNVTVLLGNGSGGFTLPSLFAVGTLPRSVALGNVNGDGRLDIVTANEGSSNVTVLLGSGGGAFTPAPSSPFGVGLDFNSVALDPGSVALGDVNGDGRLDIVTASELPVGDVSVLHGNGSGGFTAAIGSPFAFGTPNFIVLGDVNGDGVLDIVTTSTFSNNVTVRLGDGSGGYRWPSSFPVQGENPVSVALGDVNTDGFLDIVTADHDTDHVSVLLGNGTGGFTPGGWGFGVGWHPYSVALGDVNGDGVLDIVTANYSSNNVTVLLGDGSGGFVAASGSPFPVDWHPQSVALGDVNRDGKLDIVTAHSTDNVTVLLQCPTMTLSPATLPAGVVGSAYSQTIGSAGGTGTVTYTVTSGSLPPNLTLSAGGVLSGTPLATGSSSITVTATDVDGCTGSQAYTLMVGKGTSTSGVASSLNPSIFGQSVTFTATVTGGGLPPTGMVIFLDGATFLGLTTLNGSGEATYSTSSLAAGGHSITALYTGDATYNSSTSPAIVQAVGAISPPSISKTFSPPSIRLNATSTLTLTLANPAGNHGLASGIAFTDAFPAGLQVAANPGAVNNCGGTFTGGAGATSISLSGAGTLSPGNSCTLSVNVVATTAGTKYNTTGAISSTEGGTGAPSNTASLAVCPDIAIAPATLPAGTLRTPYSQTISASGGSMPYRYSQTAGSLPTGLVLNAGTGTISGTPEAQGSYAFTVTAVDAQGCSGTQSYTISIGCPPITLAPSALPNGTTGTTYSQTLTATGVAGSVTFAATGDLPPGLSLSATGVFSGTPTMAGSYSFTVTATDSQGCAGVASYTVTIGASSSATTTSLTSSLNPSLFGKAVTFTASVVAASGTSTPAGSVTFSDGTGPLGSGALDGTGAASFTTSSLAVGSHPMTAAYAGSASFSASSSAPLTQVVLTSGGCPSGDDTTACLFLNGRFRIQVQWTNPYDPSDEGLQHPGHAVQLTGDTAYFWFFAPTNMELIVKLVDGRAVAGSGKIWFFWGAVTDVEYWINVTDTQTGTVKTYHNPPKTLGSGYDTGTFSDAPLGAASAQSEPEDWLTATLAQGVRLSVSELLGEPERMEKAPPTAVPLAGAPCAADDTTLCLNESRFQVRVVWKNYTYDTTGDGHTLPVTSDSGCFWFFQSANIELAIKVLDGRAANGKYWVLYGALTDVEYTITITDTVTGAVKTYFNPAHTQASFADTDTFSP